MMVQKKRYYVVVKGRNPGIYTRWDGENGAADQVKGYPDAIYKSFHARESALEWLRALNLGTSQENVPDLIALVENIPADRQIEDAQVILESGVVLIYTDGSAITNPGPGGYGVVLRDKDGSEELSGGFRMTTNSRMEIMACLKALQTLKRKSDVVLYSDSRYVVNAIEKGWAKKWQANEWLTEDGRVVKNSDLWEQLLATYEQHDVQFRWLRGHAGNPDNERVDQLARSAAQGKNLPPDVGYESTPVSDA